MKRQYSRPVIEKINFNYKTQIMTTSPQECFESVMNVRSNGTSGQVPISECVSGNVIYIGWTNPQTGVE